MMQYFVMLATVLLVSCTTGDGTQPPVGAVLDGITGTMSGAIHSARSYVGSVIDGVKFIKQDVDERVDKVSEGVSKIKEGKELIDEGLGR